MRGPQARLIEGRRSVPQVYESNLQMGGVTSLHYNARRTAREKQEGRIFSNRPRQGHTGKTGFIYPSATGIAIPGPKFP